MTFEPNIVIGIIAYIISGIASYIIAMLAIRRGFAEGPNQEASSKDNKACMVISLFGPISLVSIIVLYFVLRPVTNRGNKNV